MFLSNRFRFTFALPIDLHNAFKRLAYSKGITISEYLRNFMRQEVEQNDKSR